MVCIIHLIQSRKLRWAGHIGEGRRQECFQNFNRKETFRKAQAQDDIRDLKEMGISIRNQVDSAQDRDYLGASRFHKPWSQYVTVSINNKYYFSFYFTLKLVFIYFYRVAFFLTWQYFVTKLDSKILINANFYTLLCYLVSAKGFWMISICHHHLLFD